MYFILAFLASLAVSTKAQDLSKLPQCAASAAVSGISSSGCELENIKCICQATAFLESLQTIIGETCPPDERKRTISIAAEICSSVGVTLPTNAAGAQIVSSAVSTPTASQTAQTAPTTSKSTAPTGSATPAIDSDNSTCPTEPATPAEDDSISNSDDSACTTEAITVTPSASYYSYPPSGTSYPTLSSSLHNITNSTTSFHPIAFTGIASRPGAGWFASGISLLGAVVVGVWGF